MEKMVFVNEEGRKAYITVYAPKAGTWYTVNFDCYNSKEFKTLNGAKRYLERNGYVEA